MSALIAYRGVGKVFPGVVALDGVSFSVAGGEVRALMGENGAGKSTLLKILAGEHRPDSGGLLVEGRPVAFAGPRDSQAAGIAIIHQELHLAPDLSVTENLLLGMMPTRFGIIDRRAALYQFTIDRHLFAGAHAKSVADANEVQVTSSSVPSARTRRAVFGAKSSRARMAPEVCSRARSSRTWPSRTRTVITAAASK